MNEPTMAAITFAFLAVPCSAVQERLDFAERVLSRRDDRMGVLPKPQAD